MNGSQIIGETWTQNNVEYLFVYLYDENGSPIGMKCRTSLQAEDVFSCYFFEKNLQGDIIAVYNESGTKIGTYAYDAWGNVTITSGSSNKVVTTHNPFRYRGYYYDVETGFYYLQSRYYNPSWGRFLNADGYINANGDILGYNMFAYCGNNPVMGYDPTGEFDWKKFWDGTVNVVAGFIGVLGGTGKAIATLIETKGDGEAALKAGAKTAVDTFSGINNAVNSTYYFIALPEALPETDEQSAYVANGYISRWDRLKHAKKMTNDWYYTEDAKNYYAEYSAHMYAWFVTGWAIDKNIPWVSEKASMAKRADIVVGQPDIRGDGVSWFIGIIGGLGI